MKKTFGILFTCVFLSSTNINAKSSTDPYACWDIADATLAAYQKASLKFKRIDTREDEDEIWNTAYDNCMN